MAWKPTVAWERQVAVHETGHAVVGVLAGRGVARVTARADEASGTAGACHYRTPLPHPDLYDGEWSRWRVLARRHLRATLGRPLAQARALGREE